MSIELLQLIEYLDYIGVFVFAISGLLAAREKNLDLFGGLAVAFVTALGGGSIRDILLGADVTWMVNNTYVYIVFLGATAAIVFNKKAARLRKAIFLFDTIGLGVFTIIGVRKAIEYDMSPVIVIILGMVTATFGGVIRDIVCNEIPLLFREEVYALVTFVGSIIYLVLIKMGLTDWIAIVASITVIITLRAIAVWKKINIPILNND